MEKLNNIPVELNVGEIRKRLHLEKKEKEWAHAKALVEAVQPLIKPRAVYKVSYIESKHDNGIGIEGVRLVSRLLREHLDKAIRVFPYVFTIGDELEKKARVSSDLLDQYYLDIIGNVAMTMIRKYFEDRLRSVYGLATISYMSPGSLNDWPIEQQRPLFSILGDVEASIGVRLSENFLMIPSKSVSGIYFPTEISFYSCQLCPRENCPTRKAPYDKELAKKYT